jgi:hypothetical protein
MAWRTILPEKKDRAHPASTGPLLNSSFAADTSRSALAKGLPFAMLVDLFMPALDERIFNKRVERCQRPRNLHPHVPPYLSRGDRRGLTRHGLVRQLSDGTPHQRRPIVPNRQSRQLKSVPPLRLGGHNFLSHRLAVPRQMPQPRPPCWSRSTKRPLSSPISPPSSPSSPRSPPYSPLTKNLRPPLKIMHQYQVCNIRTSDKIMLCGRCPGAAGRVRRDTVGRGGVSLGKGKVKHTCAVISKS